MTPTFKMTAKQSCATALKHWLRDRPAFNGYSMSPTNGRTTISLSIGDPDARQWAGRIVCMGDVAAAERLAEDVVRRHIRLAEMHAGMGQETMP